MLKVIKAMSSLCLKHGEYPTDKYLIASYEEALFPMYAMFYELSPPRAHVKVHTMDDLTKVQSMVDVGETNAEILEAILGPRNQMMARNPEFFSDAALSKVFALHFIYVLRLENQIERLAKGELPIELGKLDPDVAAEVLDKIPTLFDLKDLSIQQRVTLVGFFHGFRFHCWPGRVQACAMRHISLVLGFTDYDDLTPHHIQQLLQWLASTLFLAADGVHTEKINGAMTIVNNSPDFDNALIQVKGCILRLKLHAYDSQLLTLGLAGGTRELTDELLDFGKNVLYTLSNDPVSPFYPSSFLLHLPTLVLIALPLT